MADYNIFLGERNMGLKHYFKQCSNNELINELKRICKKKNEDIYYHDVEVVIIILSILKQREVI